MIFYMKKLNTLLIGCAALVISGCSNIQTEYEKQKSIIQEQKVIIQELTDTNSNLKTQNLELDSELKKAMAKADYGTKIEDLNSSYEAKLEQLIKSMSASLNSNLGGPGVSVVQTAEGAVIRMEGKILFLSGSAELSKQGQDVLRKISVELNKYPDRTIRVDGHTDSDPIKKSKYSSNWELSAKRSTRVVEYLTTSGKVSPKRIFLAGYSYHKPISKSEKAMNRRVEIVVLK